MSEAVDGFVLAGGRGTRMGVDKARAAYRGWPLAVATIGVLRAVCGRVALARRGAPDGLPWVLPDGAPIEVLYESDDGEPHPLWGVAMALAACRTERALVAACDVPGLSPESLRALIAAGPAVAAAEGLRHPLVAVLPAAWADRARTLASSGSSVHALVEALPAVELPAEELRDRNRPEDLGPGPVATLLAGLPWLDEAALTRVRAGEIARLAARGAIDPSA